MNQVGDIAQQTFQRANVDVGVIRPPPGKPLQRPGEGFLQIGVELGRADMLVETVNLIDRQGGELRVAVVRERLNRQINRVTT